MRTAKGLLVISLLFMLFNGEKDDKNNSLYAWESSPFSLLRTRGTKLVDEKGREVILKGVNLGNWLLLEMWMLSLDGRGLADQYELEEVLAARFGREEKDRLMDAYRRNYITERDFAIIKSFGMNVVRLPFWYTLLEDDSQPRKLKANSWVWLDRAVSMAEECGLYVVLDLHGAPGSQNMWDHSGRTGYNRLWSDKALQERTVWLWRQIAGHYKGRKSVCAYDLLNEPWGGTPQALRDLNVRCYRAVREVDREHIIIFSSYFNKIDFYGSPEANGWRNIAFTCHFYPGFFGNGEPVPETHISFIRDTLPAYADLLKELDAPLLVGEFNVVLKKAGGGEMMRRYFDLYSGLGWAATMWSYKVFTGRGGIGDGVWGMVTNAHALESIDFRQDSREKIMDWFSRLSSMEYVLDQDLQQWLLKE